MFKQHIDQGQFQGNYDQLQLSFMTLIYLFSPQNKSFIFFQSPNCLIHLYQWETFCWWKKYYINFPGISERKICKRLIFSMITCWWLHHQLSSNIILSLIPTNYTNSCLNNTNFKCDKLLKTNDVAVVRILKPSCLSILLSKSGSCLKSFRITSRNKK